MPDIVSVALFIAVAALLVPYVLGPIVVYLTFSMPARYDLREIPWNTFLSDRSDEFMEVHSQLLDLNFVPVGASLVEASHATTQFSLYRHSESTVTATLMSSTAPNIAERLTIDFTQRFADDFHLTINNMTDANVFAPTSKKTMYRFPEETDPASLFVKFNAILYSLGREDAIEMPPGDEFAYISKYVTNEMEELAASGIAKKSDDGSRIKFSLRGAFIGTWRLLWPLKGILKRRDLSRAQLAARGM